VVTFDVAGDALEPSAADNASPSIEWDGPYYETERIRSPQLSVPLVSVSV
jgi:hypothetical protein